MAADDARRSPRSRSLGLDLGAPILLFRRSSVAGVCWGTAHAWKEGVRRVPGPCSCGPLTWLNRTTCRTRRFGPSGTCKRGWKASLLSRRPLARRSARGHGGVRANRRRLAADDRWRFMDEVVVGERFDHEQGEVDPAREVAREEGIADVPASRGQALARALLQIAPADYGPARIARVHQPARHDLVVEVDDAGQSAERPSDADLCLVLPGIDIGVIPRGPPAAGKHQARVIRGVVEDRPGRAQWSCFIPQGTSTQSAPSQPARARPITSGSFVAPGTISIRRGRHRACPRSAHDRRRRPRNRVRARG